MHIQWFPGHMTKALRMMEENVKLVDAVIYVLDSRAVRSSINPSFDRVIGDRPVLYAANKADLAAEAVNRAWVRHFAAEGKVCVAVDGTKAAAGKLLAAKLTELLREKLERYAARGMNKSVRAMVIGIPNSGKSTLINTMCGEKRAITGDKAGVTRGKQWVKVGRSIELLDTPGTLCPAFEDQEVARHLAYIGSVSEDVVDREELCLAFIREMSERFPAVLTERYGIVPSGEPLTDYEAICKARGFLLRGGECDYERCAKAVLDDFRKGRFGRISLETPEG